jgi:hypothetical protein
MNTWETRRILVTVKAYPNPSSKYDETVCVAGIDVNSKEWIRLYPVPYCRSSIVESVTPQSGDKRTTRAFRC